MALLASCFCCSLSVCCGVLGVYLLVAYVISFSIELWWLLETEDPLPVPAYLLSVGYFTLFLFSSLLLHGLSVKKSTYLLVWMFLMGILLGPEAGLVLYMSIHHWRITTLYGLIEVTCWTCRLLVNVTAMICVQSLYSTWREEKTLLLRLQALKLSPVPAYHRDRLSSIKLPRHDYMNHGYQPDGKPDGFISDYQHHNPSIDENIFLDPFFIAPMESLSEFNASSFDANVIDSRAKLSMPQIQEEEPQEDEEGEEDAKRLKSQSLLDFRDTEDYNNIEAVKNKKQNKSISLNYINYLGKKDKEADTVDNNTQSLDRRIVKNNKNLKILKKFSPFLGRKNNDEINIYQIHPPKIMENFQNPEFPGPPHTTQLDNQLNKVYSSRGMYAFDDKSKKIIFYPPEFFNRDEMKNFRTRLASNESSQSRSSVDDDSEDLRRIGDIAL